MNTNTNTNSYKLKMQHFMQLWDSRAWLYKMNFSLKWQLLYTTFKSVAVGNRKQNFFQHDSSESCHLCDTFYSCHLQQMIEFHLLLNYRILTVCPIQVVSQNESQLALTSAQCKGSYENIEAESFFSNHTQYFLFFYCLSNSEVDVESWLCFVECINTFS